jgi:predicted amidohydrolase YtcJ
MTCLVCSLTLKKGAENEMKMRAMTNNINIMLVTTFACVASVLSGVSFAADTVADSVYINGNIYTMDDTHPQAEAIAIRGQKLTYVGDSEGIKNFIGDNTKIVDLKGKTVLPGLLEGHMHFPMLGENLLKIDAFWKPKAEILEAVKNQASLLSPGEWITGFGWNNTIWDDQNYPTKEELDAVSPDNPVVLERTDGHMIWVNSLALKLAGITKDSTDPQGGEILRNSDGEPSGCLTDTASVPVNKIIPILSHSRQKEAMLKAQDQLFSYGFTGVMDAGSPLSTIDLVKDLYAENKLKIRLYGLIGGAWGAGLGDPEKAYITSQKPQSELYDYRLSLNCIKFFADGSLGSRSAALLESYSDRPGHSGNYKYTDEELYKAIKQAYDNGYQVATHAIGDGGVHQVINAYEKVMSENPRDDSRLRIEHFQVSTLDDIKRIAALKILPAMQPTHATSDKTMAEDRIGKDRMQGAYAWRKVIDSGSIIIGGSDAPVEMVNPYHGLYAAVTRMDRSGLPNGGWYPSEAMTRVEALKAFTIWTAYGQFEENLKGSLEVGKLADFVVIDRDYMSCAANDIKNINAVLTVVGGEEVYAMNTDAITVMWEGLPVVFQTKPTLVAGNLMVQADIMAEKMSAQYQYNQDTKVITISKDNKTIKAPSQQFSGKEFIELQKLSEAFGYALKWYDDSNTASITTM